MYEGSVCVSCMSMSTDNLEKLFSRKSSNSKVNYADILKSCLNIKVSETEGHDSICKDCCIKLKDCVDFKNQTLRSITILSSIALTDLVNDEDLENLGFHLSYKDEPNLKSEPAESNAELTKSSVFAEKLRYPKIEPYDDHLGLSGDKNVPDKKQHKTKRRTRKSVPKHLPRKSLEKVKTKPKKNKKEKECTSQRPYEISKDELKCRECSKEFASHHTLRIHYNIHFGSYVCKTCQKGFMSRETLRKHQMTHQTGPFPCEQCGKVFTNIHTFKTHKLKHNDRKCRYKCELCTQRFASSWKRDKHRHTEHGAGDRVKCQYCDQTFTYRVQLSKHISNHHKVKLFPCPVCGVTFKSANLRSHLLCVHSVGKGFRCPVQSCDVVVTYRSKLKLHLRSHNNDRRFVCNLCSKAFVQKCALRSHTKVHVRRGEFSGDPDSLVAYVEDPDVEHKGLLDTKEEDEHNNELLSPISPIDENIYSIDEIVDSEEDLGEILLDDERFLVSSDLE